jgi:meso-butanediol dehydrogenase/(S,S)-butanediol dehydrogenase/diacetyl reductase
MTNTDLSDKVAAVTGGASGIGRATVLHLLDRGASVLAVGRDQRALARLAEESGDRPGTLRTWAADVTNEADVSGYVEQATSEFGRLTTLINNAGILIPDTVTAASSDEFDRTFAVNVRGTFLGCKYAVPAMLAAGGGSIINVGSINSFVAELELAAYCASNGAVLMLTKSVALDFADQGIRCNCVCPGFVDTVINVPHYERLGGRQAMEAGLADFQPIARPIEADEIAQTIGFLASDASSAITGSAIVIDGGVTAK